MAKLIPYIDPNTIENAGEQQVARALVEQLDDDVIVFHSYPWLQHKENGKTHHTHLQPGEADFVIVDPNQGLMVLEVKGGIVEYDAQRDMWLQSNIMTGNSHQIQDPFKQAERNKWAIKEQILSHRSFPKNQDLPFTLAHAVVFTHSRVDNNSQYPPHVERETIVDASDLSNIAKYLRRAFSAWRPFKNAYPLAPNYVDTILDALKPSFKMMPVLWRTIEEQEQRLHALTLNQQLVMNALSNQTRAAVEGSAGSGKTLLALAQAQRFATAGKRTLFLCFNSQLAEWLRSEMPEQFRDQIVIQNYHSLCRELAIKADIPFRPPLGDQSFWDEKAPEILDQAVSLLDDNDLFDAIIVDEGQDFKAIWWVTIENLYRSTANEKLMFVFFDPRQSIYTNEVTLPDGMNKPFLLTLNCRNTRKIARHCSDILAVDSDVHPGAPVGNDPVIHTAKTEEEVYHLTRKEIAQWQLQPKQVVILVRSMSSIEKWPAKLGNIALTTDLNEWRANQAVLLSTVRKFKGLEAAALILAGIPSPDPDTSYGPNEHYVACSRAKHLLTTIFYD